MLYYAILLTIWTNHFGWTIQHSFWMIQTQPYRGWWEAIQPFQNSSEIYIKFRKFLISVATWFFFPRCWPVGFVMCFPDVGFFPGPEVGLSSFLVGVLALAYHRLGGAHRRLPGRCGGTEQSLGQNVIYEKGGKRSWKIDVLFQLETLENCIMFMRIVRKWYADIIWYHLIVNFFRTKHESLNEKAWIFQNFEWLVGVDIIAAAFFGLIFLGDLDRHHFVFCLVWLIFLGIVGSIFLAGFFSMFFGFPKKVRQPSLGRTFQCGSPRITVSFSFRRYDGPFMWIDTCNILYFDIFWRALCNYYESLG